jgi:ferritin
LDRGAGWRKGKQIVLQAFQDLPWRSAKNHSAPLHHLPAAGSMRSNSNPTRVMTLNPKLTKLLNEQINNEMSSSYVYLAMAAWFEQTPYSGFAQWMFAQSREETMHALKFYQYLVDRDAKVEFQPIAKPKADFKSPIDVFQHSLKQEQRVTQQINDLFEVAEQVKDHASKNLLLWFLNEQMEEEKTVGDMLDRLKLADNDTASLLVLDREAGSRPSGGGKPDGRPGGGAGA